MGRAFLHIPKISELLDSSRSVCKLFLCRIAGRYTLKYVSRVVFCNTDRRYDIPLDPIQFKKTLFFKFQQISGEISTNYDFKYTD